VRPNPIGTSIVQLVKVEGPVLLVRGLDCLDGTPQETITGPILSAVYGVEVMVERTESGRYVVAPRS
jgi:ABC-type cobalamin/Fe3+-siderophores transport system ATPase subunit